MLHLVVMSWFMHAQLLRSCPALCDHMECSRQNSLSMGFYRQEYCSRLPCPPSEDLPDPGIKPASPASSALQADSLPLGHQGSLSCLGNYL